MIGKLIKISISHRETLWAKVIEIDSFDIYRVELKNTPITGSFIWGDSILVEYSDFRYTPIEGQEENFFKKRGKSSIIIENDKYKKVFEK